MTAERGMWPFHDLPVAEENARYQGASATGMPSMPSRGSSNSIEIRKKKYSGQIRNARQYIKRRHIDRAVSILFAEQQLGDQIRLSTKNTATAA